MMVVGGMTRPSDLGGLGVLATLAGLLGTGCLLAATFGAAADLTALAGAVLVAGGFAAVVGFLTGGLGATLAATRSGVLAAGVLAAGLLLCDDVFAGLADTATDLATFGAGLIADFVFTGVAFTSRLLTELVCPLVVLSDPPRVDVHTRC